MARPMTPERAAWELAKWADAGFDGHAVLALKAALARDVTAAQGRVPRKSGALASTIRVAEPKVKAAVRRGYVRVDIVAGRKSVDRRKRVAYAGVLQRGAVRSGAGYVERSKPHVIRARKGEYSGSSLRTTGRLRFKSRSGAWVSAPEVQHPGSKWPRLEYLQVDEGRVRTNVEKGIRDGYERASQGAT